MKEKKLNAEEARSYLNSRENNVSSVGEGMQDYDFNS